MLTQESAGCTRSRARTKCCRLLSCASSVLALHAPHQQDLEEELHGLQVHVPQGLRYRRGAISHRPGGPPRGAVRHRHWRGGAVATASSAVNSQQSTVNSQKFSRGRPRVDPAGSHAGEHGWRPTKDELKTAQGRNLPDSLINKLKETRKGKNKQVSAVSIQFRL